MFLGCSCNPSDTPGCSQAVSSLPRTKVEFAKCGVPTYTVLEHRKEPRKTFKDRIKSIMNLKVSLLPTPCLIFTIGNKKDDRAWDQAHFSNYLEAAAHKQHPVVLARDVRLVAVARSQLVVHAGPSSSGSPSTQSLPALSRRAC